MEGPVRQNQASFWIAIALIVVGAFFFIVEVFNIRLGIQWWPLLFLLPGLAMLAWAFSMRTVNSGLAVAGANLAVLGAIFLYQSASNNWESWTYIWTLFPLATGLALMAAGSRNDDETLTRSGLESARWGGIAFVIGVVVFEVFIFGGLIGYIIPLLLVAAGGFILWNNSRNDARGFGPSSSSAPTPFGEPAPDTPPLAPTSPVMAPRAPPPVPPAPASVTPPAPPSSVVTPPPPVAPSSAVEPRLHEPPPQTPAADTMTPMVTPPASGTEPETPAPAPDELSPEPFPADELPEPPPSDDAAFPADDEALAPPPASSPRAPSSKSRPRRPH